MRIHVLGSAAGGGFPQWNCGCVNCRGMREGAIQATPRSQCSIAVSARPDAWFLIHASPDIRTQLLSFPPLHPTGLRHSPVAGIVLTNADLDQCLGLLSLRESQPIHVYATETVRQAFTQSNRLYRALQRRPDQITWHALKLEVSQPFYDAKGRPSGFTITPLPVPGKPPLYLEGLVESTAEDNLALLVTEENDGPCLGYAPCVGGLSSHVDQLLDRADCLFFDGTFWSDDELSRLEIAARTAREMAHWPLGGPDGSLNRIGAARAEQKYLIHINNTNPVLREDAPERRETECRNVQIAYDGLEVGL
jgi:pyrroloquinoline quinone biosynthesis protein B